MTFSYKILSATNLKFLVFAFTLVLLNQTTIYCVDNPYYSKIDHLNCLQHIGINNYCNPEAYNKKTPPITHTFSQSDTITKEIPLWFLEDLKNNIGTWITSNEKYKSENEPYTEYGIEWKWALDENSIVGRLFGLIEGREIGDFWQFRQYWDNINSKAVVAQYGYGGVTGFGHLAQLPDGYTESIQVFSTPNKVSWHEKHLTIRDTAQFTTTSYDKDENNKWQKKRSYTWIKKQEKQKLDLFLFGTFHFDNPGLDMVKTKSFDILSKNSQTELEHITEDIKSFNPTKIFVEWSYKNQSILDSLYTLYLKNPNHFIENTESSFYQKNEIFQVAFRAARKLGLNKLYAVDYHVKSGPLTDSLMRVIEDKNQMELKHKILSLIKKRQSFVNNLIDSDLSLGQMLQIHNSPEDYAENLNSYTGMITEAGDLDIHIGAHFASNWYERNIHIWSLIQKQLQPEDQRVMILFGAGHTAVFNQILKQNNNLNIVNYTDVINH